jgi:hypothetical protein
MIAVLLLLAIFFHTNVQLEEWFDDWAMRADYSLSAQLLDELQDMEERHPYWRQSPQHIHISPSYSGGYSFTVEQWRPLVATYFASDKVATAMCILNYETGETGDPNSKNTRSSAAGLFQFLRDTWDSVPLSITGGSYDSGMVYNPEASVRAAAWLQNHYGWGQWTVYPLCRGL